MKTRCTLTVEFGLLQVMESVCRSLSLAAAYRRIRCSETKAALRVADAVIARRQLALARQARLSAPGRWLP